MRAMAVEAELRARGGGVSLRAVKRRSASSKADAILSARGGADRRGGVRLSAVAVKRGGARLSAKGGASLSEKGGGVSLSAGKRGGAVLSATALRRGGASLSEKRGGAVLSAKAVEAELAAPLTFAPRDEQDDADEAAPLL